MKKLLFLIDNLQIGGAEQVFVDIVNLCNYKIDFDVLLITDTNKNEYQIPENVNVIRLNRKNKFSLISLIRVGRILKKYSVAHIHMRHTYRYLTLVKKFFKLRIRFVFHDHLGININKNLPFKFALFNKPDFYIGVSKESSEWANEVWKIEKSRIYLLPNLPKLAFVHLFENCSSRKWNWRKITELEAVCVGNLKRGKNQLFAIELATKLNFNLTLVGKNQDDSYYNHILESSENSNIKKIEDCNNTEDILGNYDFALMVSENESGPLVLMEYLLAGIPFLAYQTGGISEILVKYFPEFFIDNLDINIWVERLKIFLIERPEVDKNMVCKILEENFNREIYLNQLLKIYNDASS